VSQAREPVRRPEAKAESVEDLVAAVVRGEVRIPVFQRGLAWTATNVVELFDSIYRGFPIGSLLFRRGPAQAGPLKIGPLEVFGQEMSNALWVVDGQQRLTSLAAALARPPSAVREDGDVYVISFDAANQKFHATKPAELVPETSVPLSVLLDAGQLSEWMFGWSHGRDPALRMGVFEAGRRLREYRVPVYIIDTDDENVLREIFFRVNHAGKPLNWAEVHDALHGHRGQEPSTVTALKDQLSTLGMGRLDDEQHLYPALMAFCGVDMSQSFGDHLRGTPERFTGVVAEAAPSLRKALSFLRTRAEIPHLTLLPYSAPLVILTRFFKEHPEPNLRTQTLLVRWIWRSFMKLVFDDRAAIASGLALISEDEEASAQRLLGQEEGGFSSPGHLPMRFDALDSHSKIWFLSLWSLRPLQLSPGREGTHHPIDLGEVLEASDQGSRPLLARGVIPNETTVANRILLSGQGSAEREVESFIQRVGPEHPVLVSHAISKKCALALRDRDWELALMEREQSLFEVLSDFSGRLAEWGHSDRPSIDYLLAQSSGE
jgi:Protein of unknown function DUF262